MTPQPAITPAADAAGDQAAAGARNGAAVELGLRCWTRGGDALVHQHCDACDHRWYFQRDFCPRCGHAPPDTSSLSGRGEVHATTLVHRAPSDEFRAIAPYRVVLVDADEGVRLMGHGDPGLVLGDRVRGGLRLIAGRLMPYFEKDSSA